MLVFLARDTTLLLFLGLVDVIDGVGRGPVVDGFVNALPVESPGREPDCASH